MSNLQTKLKSEDISPQDPFHSVLVSASAGCGKTYQLAQRFLCLIAAGADPAKILTVTFTKKAAAEMQSRIIEDALKLMHDDRSAQEFDTKMANFYAATSAKGAPPLPAKVVGSTILLNTQRLAINTIDGIFWQWTQRFPMEASLTLNDVDQWEGAAQLPALFTLTNADLEVTIADHAWDKALHDINLSNPVLLSNLLEYFDLDLFHLRSTVNRLTQHASFCWHLEAKGLPSYETWSQLRQKSNIADSVAFQNEHRDAFARIAEATGSSEAKTAINLFVSQWSEVNPSPTCDALHNAGVLTKDGRVSGSLLRGSKREALYQEIESAEDLTRKITNLEKFKRFDIYGTALFTLTQMYSRHQRDGRQSRGVITFDELSRAAFRLFKNPDTAAVRLQILRGVEHLLLDEFQDTSRLQWEVFSEIARELLAAGQSAAMTRASVFIVGDIKQSVYGFREADPQVMEAAKGDLSPFGLKPVGLDHSFRSSNVVLNFINQVFQAPSAATYGAAAPLQLHEFRPHRTAFSEDKFSPVVPDFGSVTITPLFIAEKNEFENFSDTQSNQEVTALGTTADDRSFENDAFEAPVDIVSQHIEQKAVEKEAAFLAQHLLQQLSPDSRSRVFDKKSKKLRPMTPKDCVVLYRNKTNAEVFARALRKVGIATQRVEEVGFFQRQEIVDLTALLRWLVMPADALSLATVLRSPLFAIEDKELFAAFASDSEKSCSPKEPLHALGLENDSGFRIGLTRHSLRFGTFETISSLVASFIERQSIGKRLRQAWGNEEGTQAEANAFYFLDMLRSQEISGTSAPFHLLAEMERLAAENQIGSLPVCSDSVTLMTLHKSKGLEFPFVAIVETASSWMKQDPEWLRYSDGKSEPDLRYIGKKKQRPVGDLLFDQTIDVNLQSMLEECYRLLYVGLTRAQHHLYISGHQPARTLTSGQPCFHEILRIHLEGMPGSATREFLGTTVTEFVRLPLDAAVFPDTASSHGKSGYAAADLYDSVSDLTRQSRHNETLTEVGKASSKIPPPLYFRIAHRNELSTPDLTLGKVRTASTNADSRAFRGTFWHKCFEMLCKGAASAEVNDASRVDAAAVWRQLALNSKNARQWEKDEELFDKARQIFLDAVASAAWSKITKNAEGYMPELPVVHLKETELVSGQMDLVVHKADEVWVVDYKGSEIEYVAEGHSVINSEIETEDLMLFSRDQGYDRQVRDYMEAAASLYKEKRVRGFLFFIVTRQLLEI